jgi:NTE family protein
VSRALVLGGGGVSGIAWEVGVLLGLRDAGLDVTAWDRVIGTSAGSIVGARLLGEAGLDDVYASQAEATPGSNDDWVRTLGGRLGTFALLAGRRRWLGWLPRVWLTGIGLETLVRRAARPLRPGRWVAEPAAAVTEPNAMMARVGSLALAARTAPESAFVDVVASLLGPVTEWPERLEVTAVDALTGATVVFDRSSGVQLARAVAASCALPTVLPPVTIRGRPYIDGGVGSEANLGLAAGCDEVLAILPVDFGRASAEEVALRSSGARMTAIRPSAAGRAAVGHDIELLDPDRRPAAAVAGREDGRYLPQTNQWNVHLPPVETRTIGPQIGRPPRSHARLREQHLGGGTASRPARRPSA